MKKKSLLFILGGIAILFSTLVFLKIRGSPSVNFPKSLQKNPPGLHPRIYLSKDTVASLKEAVKSDLAQIWRPIKARVDKILDSSPPPRAEGDIRKVGEVIPYAAICYLITGEESYLKLAKRFMLGIAEYPHWGNDHDIEAAHLLYAEALGYDWLYHRLNRLEREVIKNKIAVQGQRLRPFFHLVHPPLNNHRTVNLSSLGIAGLVLYGEAPEAGEWINYVNEQFKNTLKYYGRDGVSCEGISYWSYTVEYMLKYFTAADELLGENFLKHPWLENAASCPLYHSLPSRYWNANNMFLNFGDSPRFCWYGPHYQLFKLASLYRRPEIQWLAEEILRSGITKWHSDWLSIIWYDPSLKSEEPDDMPLTEIYDDWYIAVMRSAWNGEENVVAFKCSSIGGNQLSMISDPQYPGSGHCQPDANSFILFGKGEWLAAAPGATLIKRTENHNTVVAGGLGQLGEGHRWFKGKLQFKRRRKARFLLQESCPQYDYVIGDAGSIYREETGMKKFLRHLIYLKPEIIVIIDELSAEKPAEFEWLLHTPGEITIKNEGDIQIKNNNALLRIAVLSPQDAKISSGSRVVPAEYPELDWNNLNVLTLSTGQPRRETIFISVLLIGEPGQPPLKAEFFKEDDGTMIEIRTGTQKKKIFLSGLGEEREEPGIVTRIN